MFIVRLINRFWDWIEYDHRNPTWQLAVKTTLRFVTIPLYILWVILEALFSKSPARPQTPWIMHRPLTPYERTFAPQQHAAFQASMERARRNRT